MSVAVQAAAAPAPSYNFPDGKVKPWVIRAGYILGPLFNINNIGSWRESDPFPDHPSGHALDFMITNPGTSAGYKQGDALASFAQRHAQELGIEYIIWNRQYWSSGLGVGNVAVGGDHEATGGWVPYTDTSNPHTDHVHITFYDSPAAWTTSNAAASNAITAAGGSGVIPASLQLAADTSDTCAFPVSFFPGNNNCLATKVVVRQAAGWFLIITAGGGIFLGIAIIAAFTFKTPVTRGLVIPNLVNKIGNRYRAGDAGGEVEV